MLKRQNFSIETSEEPAGMKRMPSTDGGIFRGVASGYCKEGDIQNPYKERIYCICSSDSNKWPHHQQTPPHVEEMCLFCPPFPQRFCSHTTVEWCEGITQTSLVMLQNFGVCYSRTRKCACFEIGDFYFGAVSFALDFLKPMHFNKQRYYYGCLLPR